MNETSRHIDGSTPIVIARRRQPLLLITFFSMALLITLTAAPSKRFGTVTTAAPAGKPSPSPTPANNTTSTIYDKSVDDTTFLDLRSDDLNPDLTPSAGAFGTYGNSATNSVLDRFEGASNSDWSLHLENSSTRWISLTLNRLTGTGPTGVYTLHARVISRCFDPTGATQNTMGWPTITASDPNCSMHINFSLSTTDYALIMSPYYDNTGRATVSCNALSAGQCVDWTIVPNLTADSVINPNPLVGDLFSFAPHNGKMTLVGTYSLTYRVHLTSP